MKNFEGCTALKKLKPDRSKILMIPEGSTSVSDEFGTKTFYPKNPIGPQ